METLTPTMTVILPRAVLNQRNDWTVPIETAYNSPVGSCGGPFLNEPK